MTTSPKEDIMEVILNRIEKAVADNYSELSKIRDSVASLAIISAQHQATLDEHIRRTELAEIAIKEVDQRVVPIEKHVSMWAGVGKAIVILSGLSALATFFYKILV